MTPQPTPASGLPEARQHCHHAVQFIARFGRAYLPPKDDDSHTSMTWDPTNSALVSQPFAKLQIGVRLHDLTLLVLQNGRPSAELRLSQRNVSDATLWLQHHLQAAGLDPELLTRPLHYEIPDHPLAHGARFQTNGLTPALQTLANLYNTTAALLNTLRTRDASPVRCWPHHFDIAVLFTKQDRWVNAGLSPGDAGYTQPYYYVSPYPYPPVDTLPPLDAPAHWHTEKWVGAVLPYEQLNPDLAEQSDQVHRFFSGVLRQLDIR